MLSTVRADRLIATLLLMQARGTVTAAQIASELEVSERTARRDLEALAISGVPVYSTRGRGGGWTLVGGAKTDLTGLTSSEANALSLAASIGASGLPGNQLDGSALASAMSKLMEAIPETFKSSVDATRRAVVVDPNRWSGPMAAESNQFLDLLHKAVTEGNQIDLEYRSPRGALTNRRVHPLGLITKASTWYLVAGTDRGQRTFRLSRIVEVSLTDLAADRPPGFDLEAAWMGAKESFADRVGGVDIVADALVEEWTTDLIARASSVRVTPTGSPEDGRVKVEVAGPSVAVLAHAFAGFGRAVDVFGPPELLEALANLGTHLVSQYGQNSKV